MGNLFLSPESAVKYAPSRGYIIFFPQSIAPYEKSLYVCTSFSIRFCSSEQLKFSHFYFAGRKLGIYP